MTNSKIKLPILVGAFAALGVVLFGLEKLTDGGSLLYCMLFFVAISQGPVTIVAAADVVRSDWLKPYKRELLSVYHMILCIALLFLVFTLTGKIGKFYDWTHHGTLWLNYGFFVTRNIIVLLLTWLVARRFVKESLAESPDKAKWAVIWILTYVVSQTIVAFDWVMSLVYPWISTLFGAYFFVEAFYAGLALAAVFTFLNYQRYLDEYSEARFKKSQMDMMTLLFGFSIFWAYQFFSQFIVIWYGNIPEEVSYIVHRLDKYGYSLFLVIIILFIIPFITFLFRKVKANPKACLAIAILVWSGILLERFFMLGLHMSFNPFITIIEFLLIGAMFIWVVKNGPEVALENQ